MQRILWRALTIGLLATSTMALGACGGGSDGDDGNNGDTNNGQNNGTNNGTNNGDNNGANNGDNNGDNNGTNNGDVNNTNNGGAVAACEAVCEDIGACPEFLEACPAEVVEATLPACKEACQDPESQTQIVAVGSLSCAEVVPLAINAFGLGDLCGGGEDLCAGVECDEGEVCNPETGACEGGQVNLCIGVECEDSQYCDPETGACVERPACVADANEENNTAETATALAVGSSSLSICDGDEDWFSLSLEPNQIAIIDLAFLHARGDIDARVFEADGTTPVTSSTGSSDNERLVLRSGEEGGDYRLRVYGFEGQENDYEISTRVGAKGDLCVTSSDCDAPQICGEGDQCTDQPPCASAQDCQEGQYCADSACAVYECSDDANEPGNNERASATALTGQDQTVEAVTLCADDVDWYTFTLAAGDTALLQLFFEDNTSDIDIELFLGEGETPLLRATSTTDNEFLFIEAAQESRTFFLRAFGFRGLASPYTMNLDINPEGELCNANRDCPGICDAGHCAPCDADSICGGGDVCDTGSGTCVDCLSDEQCFGGVCNPQTHSCVACLGDEDCDGERCSPENSCVECLGNGDCEEGLCETQTHSCVACLQDSDCGDGICLGNACQAATCRDAQEGNGNETADAATAITPGSYPGLMVCGDDDWYSITLAEGDQLYVQLDFTHADGDVDMIIRNPEGVEASRSSSSDDNEYAGIASASAGTYLIRIYPFQGISNSYDLSIQVNPSDFTVCRLGNDPCPEGQVCNTTLDRCEAGE